MTKHISLMGLLVAFGCSGKDDSGDTSGGDSDADTDADSDSDTDADTVFEVTLTAGGVTLDITNGACANYDFGMAQIGTSSNWTGEDCMGGMAGYDICHGASMTGVALSHVSNPDDIVAGSSTLFDIGDDGTLAYYVNDTCASSCYTFGDGTYADYSSCTAI